MKAVRWYGRNDMRVEEVPEPEIINPRDAIIRVTTAAICGSDLHMYDGYIPTMEGGDIVGHEFMGEVVEVGSKITNLKPGDRVVVPFTITCGACFFCKNELWSLCENSNPNAAIAEQFFGHTTAGLYGYSHMMGGFAGGQAEYVRVPFADTGPLKIENGIRDEQVLFLGDIFPTGYMAAENCNIQAGDTVAVWGCGPVGQFAVKSAKMLGAERVIAIDRFPERLAMAERHAGADETINYMERPDVVDELKVMTGGRGPDACIDAVGSEAHGTGPQFLFDRTMHALRMESDRPFALRQAITACRGGGTVSIPGVYGGFIDKMPMGAVMNKGLTIRTGQTHMPRYMAPLLDRIVNGEIDPSFVITHRMTLDEAPMAYRMFRDKEDDCIKVILKPQEQASSSPSAGSNGSAGAQIPNPQE